MEHTSFKMLNELALNPTESLGGYFIYEDTGRFSICLYKLQGCSGSNHTSSLGRVSTPDPLEKIFGKKKRWEQALGEGLRGTFVLTQAKLSLQPVAAQSWVCWAPSCSPCKAVPPLKSSQKRGHSWLCSTAVSEEA